MTTTPPLSQPASNPKIPDAHAIRHAYDVITAVVTSLADEGVPVRAIARSTKTPYGDVMEILNGAVHTGKLLQVPKPDWPIGKGLSRENREPQFDPFDGVTEVTLLRLFSITKLQCSLFEPLLRRKEVTRAAMHEIIEQRRKPGSPPTEEKLVDVVICNLRKKLKPFGLQIKTIWSQGYYMDAEHRGKARDMIAAHVHEAKLMATVTEPVVIDDDES